MLPAIRAETSDGEVSMTRPWSDAEKQQLRDLWNLHGGGFRKIAKIMGRTRGSIDGKSRVMGLQFRSGRARAIHADNTTPLTSTTKFPSRVVPPDDNVLKSGDNQRKLGRVVTKGRWKGYPIFSLTLEERATCPRSCKVWNSCYGNGMGHAKRYQHGADLEQQLSVELATLQMRHPQGFVVRLHILGDFYSRQYVEFWGQALQAFPALHVFGYTANLEGTPIGDAIAHLRRDQWARFAVRTSGATSGPRTMVIAHDVKMPGVIVCPAQKATLKSVSCSSCTLCWANGAQDKAIAFWEH